MHVEPLKVKNIRAPNRAHGIEAMGVLHFFRTKTKPKRVLGIFRTQTKRSCSFVLSGTTAVIDKDGKGFARNE